MPPDGTRSRHAMRHRHVESMGKQMNATNHRTLTRGWLVRGIKLRLFAFSSVATSHDSFATGLRSGRPIFVLPLLRENKTPGCPIERVLENDFVVVTGTGTARDFIRLLTVELH
jgi:hypothetical protein